MFLFPSNGKDFQNRKTMLKGIISLFCFYSLQTGRTSRTAPPTNPVTVRAKIAKTKRELRGGFFPLQILPKTPLNPYVHYTKHDFLTKLTTKQVTVYLQRHFQLPRRSIYRSRFVFIFNYTLNGQKCQIFFSCQQKKMDR